MTRVIVGPCPLPRMTLRRLSSGRPMVVLQRSVRNRGIRSCSGSDVHVDADCIALGRPDGQIEGIHLWAHEGVGSQARASETQGRSHGASGIPV